MNPPQFNRTICRTHVGPMGDHRGMEQGAPDPLLRLSDQR